MEPYYIYLRPSDDKATIIQASNDDLSDYDPERFLKNTRGEAIKYDSEATAKESLNLYIKKEFIDRQYLNHNNHWDGKLANTEGIFGIHP